MTLRLLRLALLTVLLSVLPAHAQTFTDVSDLLPDEVTDSGFLLGGASIVDIDGDGRTDLARLNTLLIQRLSGFEPVPIPSRLPLGAVFADVDKDGRSEALVLDANSPDIYEYGLARETLTPLPGAGGLNVGNAVALTQGSVLLDYDRDGKLDVLIGNDGPVDLLFRGLGNGRFRNVSAEALPQIQEGDYGMMSADYDRDGDDDVYVGICTFGQENLLYRNDNAAFSEAAASAGVTDDRRSWGVFWFDFDNDGWLDLFVANMENQNGGVGESGLYRNNTDGTFSDIAAEAGVAGSPTEDSWSATVADFDNDGWQDLFVVNRPEPSRLYRNNADGTFSDITMEAGLPSLMGLPVAAGDVNDDGWPDLYVPRARNDRDVLFYNDGGSNGWLSVDLTGVISNRDGIGARVEVTAGDLSMVREITAGDGFMSQSHGLRAHFGLGPATTADVTVRWPSGAVETITGVAANQAITIVEGLGINQPPSMFGLTSPADEAVVPLGEAVALAWEPASDAGGEAVRYTVHLAAPEGTDRTFEATEPTFTVPASALAAEGEYRWAVVASDGHTPRTSLDPFRFTTDPDVAADPDLRVAGLSLEAWPNPAGAEAVTVRITVPVAESVTLEVFDALGRRVQHLDLGTVAAGAHEAQLGVRELGAGVYVVRLTGGRSGTASVRLVRSAR